MIPGKKLIPRASRSGTDWQKDESAEMAASWIASDGPSNNPSRMTDTTLPKWGTAASPTRLSRPLVSPFNEMKTADMHWKTTFCSSSEALESFRSARNERRINSWIPNSGAIFFDHADRRSMRTHSRVISWARSVNFSSCLSTLESGKKTYSAILLSIASLWADTVLSTRRSSSKLCKRSFTFPVRPINRSADSLSLTHGGLS